MADGFGLPRTPTCGLYNLNEALDEMVEGEPSGFTVVHSS